MKTKITISFAIVFAFGSPLLKAADDLDIYGGTFTIDKDYNLVDVYNDAVVDMYEFSINYLDLYDNSIFNLHDGQIDNGIYTGNFSTLNVSVGYSGYILAESSGTVNISSGITTTIFAYDNSTVHLTGGDIVRLDAPGINAYIHIYGYEFSIDSEDNLTGYWPDGTPLDVHLMRRQFYGDHYVLHEIPEPHSLLFIGIGSVVLRRRKVSS